MTWQDQARVVGVLDIIFGAMAIVGGLIGWIVVQTGLGIAANESGEGWLNGLGAMIGLVIMLSVLLVGLPTLLAGIGLLKGQEWGRILGIVVAALWTLSILAGNVFGLIGIYMLVVLVKMADEGQQQQQTVVIVED